MTAAFWGRAGQRDGGGAAAIGGDGLAPGGIVAFTLTTNGASRRVMEKLGFRFERDIIHAGLPHVLYRLDMAPAGTRV